MTERSKEWLRWVASPLALFILWLLVPPFSIPGTDGILGKDQLIRWITLATLLFCKSSVRTWIWQDLLVCVYCICPLVSALANGDEFGFGIWETFKEFGYWAIPYWIGRSAIQHRVLSPTSIARANTATAEITLHTGVLLPILLGAILYLLPASIEIVTGPVFTKLITGQSTIGQLAGADRGWTYRPSVFLNSGFVLTMFYVLASLITSASALSLRKHDRDRTQTQTVFRRRAVLPFAIDFSEIPLRRMQWLLTTLFCALVVASLSLGSIILLGVGIASLFALAIPSIIIRRLTCIVFLVLTLAPLLYMLGRMEGGLKRSTIEAVSSSAATAQRAGSLGYRLAAEEQVRERMAGHWIFGWGDWNRWRQGDSTRVIDGFWLFSLTRTGIVSIVAWYLMVAAPVVWQFARQNEDWLANALAIFLILSLIDALFNYFGDVHQMFALGALVGFQSSHHAE